MSKFPWLPRSREEYCQNVKTPVLHDLSQQYSSPKDIIWTLNTYRFRQIVSQILWGPEYMIVFSLYMYVFYLSCIRYWLCLMCLCTNIMEITHVCWMNIWITSLGKSFLKSHSDQPIIILLGCSYFLMWMPTMKMLHRRQSHNHL